VEKNERARLLTAPKIVLYNTQRGNLFVANQFAYVKDYDVEVANDAVIADPIPGTVMDGISLDVRPTISADRKYVTLEMRPTVATLVPPPPAIERISSFLGQNTLQTLVARVNIETPRLKIETVRTTVTVPDGGTVLIGGLTNVYDEKYSSELPFVSQLPIVGSLLGRHASGRQRRSLLVLIHVKIINLEEEERLQLH
jgi:type II secretory pathway component GspD/PulD (secretin)